MADDKAVVTLGLTAMFNLDFYMNEKITFFPNFKNVEVFSAMVKHSEVPLHDGKVYSEIMEVYLNKACTAFNAKYKDGINIGILKNATMTTRVADGWMYGGFSMQQ